MKRPKRMKAQNKLNGNAGKAKAAPRVCAYCAKKPAKDYSKVT